MSIKPIDLQVQMNQMHELARREHQAEQAAAVQHQFLDKEAAKKAENADKTVTKHEDVNRAEKRDEGAPRERRRGGGKAPEEERKHSASAPVTVTDDRIGHIIDIRK